MKYRGAYYEGSDYSEGDVVVGEDRVASIALKVPPRGTDPKNTLYWGRCSGIINEVVLMLHDTLSDLQDSVSALSAAMPRNVTEEAVILKTETASYNVHVDDTGLAPEVVAEEITEDEEEGDET